MIEYNKFILLEVILQINYCTYVVEGVDTRIRRFRDPHIPTEAYCVKLPCIKQVLNPNEGLIYQAIMIHIFILLFLFRIGWGLVILICLKCHCYKHYCTWFNAELNVLNLFVIMKKENITSTTGYSVNI